MEIGRCLKGRKTLDGEGAGGLLNSRTMLKFWKTDKFCLLTSMNFRLSPSFQLPRDVLKPKLHSSQSHCTRKSYIMGQAFGFGIRPPRGYMVLESMVQ